MTRVADVTHIEKMRMPPETSATAQPAKRRRWYQFTLRTLIAGMVVASMVLGLFAFVLQRARRQAAAVATIRKHGGHVTYDYAFPDDNPRFSVLPFQARSNVPNWLLDRLGEDFFHDVVGVTARINKGISADQRQEVNRAIDTLQERNLAWVTVIESARGSLTQSQSDSPPSP